MPTWVSEFVLGRTLNRHHFNVARRTRKPFRVTVFTVPAKSNTPLYSDVDWALPVDGKVVYKLRITPKPDTPKLDTSAWSFRNDKRPYYP